MMDVFEPTAITKQRRELTVCQLNWMGVEQALGFWCER
jgi:hypothetical protein